MGKVKTDFTQLRDEEQQKQTSSKYENAISSYPTMEDYRINDDPKDDLKADWQETETTGTTPISKGLTITSNNLLKMDMATIETIARSIVQEVRDGNLDALDALIYAKKGAAFFKAIDDNVKDAAYGKQYATKGQPYEVHGCKVEALELGVKYFYEDCNDSIYEYIMQQYEDAKKHKEDREKFLKSIKGSISVNNPETGEVEEIKEPIKKGTIGYKITIK